MKKLNPRKPDSIPTTVRFCSAVATAELNQHASSENLVEGQL